MRQAASFLGLSAAGSVRFVLILEVCLRHWQALRIRDQELQAVRAGASPRLLPADTRHLLHFAIPEKESARDEGGPSLARPGARRDSWATRLRFASWLCHAPAVQPWEIHSISLSLILLMCADDYIDKLLGTGSLAHAKHTENIS